MFLTTNPLSGSICESLSQLPRKKVGRFGRSLMQVLPVSLFETTVFFNMRPDLVENHTASWASSKILLYLVLTLARNCRVCLFFLCLLPLLSLGVFVTNTVFQGSSNQFTLSKSKYAFTLSYLQTRRKQHIVLML